MKYVIYLSVIALCCATAGTAATMPYDPQAASTAVLADFMRAWSAADPERLAKLFSADADLITPDGIVSRGQPEIKSFYAAVFARGFRGSSGVGKVERVRRIAPDLLLIDAKWSIEGAQMLDGSPRKADHGILVGLIGLRDGAWRILGMRENTGATEFVPLPAATH